MGRNRNHPKRFKSCVFCYYWIGNAEMKFINSTVGYEFEANACGKCTKKNNNTKAYQSCSNYEPNMEAKRVL